MDMVERYNHHMNHWLEAELTNYPESFVKLPPKARMGELIKQIFSITLP